MSKITWYILGILTILATIVLFMGAPEKFAALTPNQRPSFIAGGILFAAVLGTTIATCFFPRVRPVSLRIIEVIGFATSVFTLIDGFYRRDFFQFPLIFSLWLPGSIYLVVKGKMN